MWWIERWSEPLAVWLAVAPLSSLEEAQREADRLQKDHGRPYRVAPRGEVIHITREQIMGDRVGLMHLHRLNR